MEDLKYLNVQDQEEGSVITHSKDPQILTFSSKQFHALILVLVGGSQIPKYQQCIGSSRVNFWLKQCQDLVFFYCPYDIMAQGHAAGVPMAIPDNCSRKEFMKLKTFHSITNVSTCRKRLVGKQFVGVNLSLRLLILSVP